MRSRCHRGCREASALPPPAWPPASPSPAQPSVKLTSGLLPGRAVLRAPRLLLTLDFSEKRQAAQPTSFSPQIQKWGWGEWGHCPTPGPFLSRGRAQKLRVCSTTLTPFPVSWEPPGVSLGPPDLLTRAKPCWTRRAR